MHKYTILDAARLSQCRKSRRGEKSGEERRAERREEEKAAAGPHLFPDLGAPNFFQASVRNT